MKQVAIKTHLIITDIHNEYDIKWSGKITETKPKMADGKPIFIIISSTDRMELNTWDISEIERIAKQLTLPRGRQAVTQDKARIYIKEEDGKETPMGVVTHKKVKKFAQMYDKVGVK